MSKKWVFLVISTVLFFGAVNAWATASRLEALGNQDLFLVDDTNAFFNPATLNYYRDCLFIHMGGVKGGDYSAVGAISFKIGENGGLGIIAGGPIALGYIVQGSISAVRADAIVPGTFVDHFGVLPGPIPPNDVDYTVDSGATFLNPIGIILDYKLGKTALGIGYFLINGKNKDDVEVAATNTKYDSEQTAMIQAFVVGMSSRVGKMQPEAWFHWDPYWVKSEYTDDNTDFESVEKLRGNRFYAGARLIYYLSDTLTVVPVVTYEHVGGHVDIDTDPNLPIPATNATVDDMEQRYKIDSVFAGVNMQYATGGFFGLLITGSVGMEWAQFLRELEIDHTHFSETSGFPEDPLDVETPVMKTFAAPVVKMGLEYWTNQTLCLRGGISTTTLMAAQRAKKDRKEVDGVKTADITEVETVQETQAAVGMGLHFGTLLIDMVFGNFFLAGEDGFSAGHGGPNLFSNLDVKLKW